MKQYHLLTLFIALLLLASCSNKTEKATLATQQDTLSWAMGMSLAQTAQSNFYDFDQDLILQAFKSTLKGDSQPLDTATYQEACDYISFLAEMHYRKQAQSASQSASAQQQQFFERLVAENPNVKQAPKGYYYEVLRNGSGPRAQLGKRIRFDFKGTEMISGRLIEQTYGVREPIIHVLEQPMFEGLLDGLQLMNAGSKFRFYFPFQLVANANGIPPYTPVIYEVELHEIYND